MYLITHWSTQACNNGLINKKSLWFYTTINTDVGIVDGIKDGAICSVAEVFGTDWTLI